MAHVLTLTDGSDTVNLTDGISVWTEDYTPSTPDTTPQVTMVEAIRDGSDVTLVTRRNVTETLEIVLKAATTTALQTVANDIERLLLQAERKQQWGAGDKVYLTAKLDGESYTWRSEVLTGQLDLAKETLRTGWPNVRIEAKLHITRRYYWEYGETNPIQLDMTSSVNTTPATTVTVYVNDDANTAQTNWFQIANSEIDGVLPAPLKLQMQNTSGAEVDYDYWHIFNNAYDDSTTFGAFLRGTSSVGGTASKSFSAGKTHDSLALETTAWIFDLGATRIATMAGEYWRVLAAFNNATDETYFRANLAFGVSTFYYFMWEGAEVYKDRLLLDLGTVPIPANVGSTKLFLVVSIRNSENTGSASLDFVQLQPAYGYRKLFLHDHFRLEDDDSVVDNGIDGYSYVLEDATSDQYPLIVAYNDPVHVYPGSANRLRLLNDDSGGWTAARTVAIQAWYRPRRLTI